MPLPFAPPPKDSRLYQQLESTTLQTLTADQLDTIRAKTFSQGTEGNEDEYRRLLLLGLAADKLSLSGPLANTQHVYSYSYTDGALTEIFAPAEGEVYQLVAIQNSFRTGQTAIRFLITDYTDGTKHCEIVDSTDEGNQLLPGSPVYIGYPCVLSQDPTGGSSGTGYTYYTVIRVR